MDINELKQKRADKIKDAQKILTTADSEERDMSDEEKTDYDALIQQVEDMAADIGRREKLAGFAADVEVVDTRQVPAENGKSEMLDASEGMPVEDIKNYSFIRAINAAVNKDWRHAGLEREASIAAADKLGKQPEGFYVPHDVLFYRDVQVGDPTKGGYMVDTDQLAPIDILFNRMVVRAAGAQVLSGLVGNVEIPTLNTSTAAYWVGEGGSPTEGAPATGQKALSPKTVGAYIDLTRRFRLQTSPAMENLFRNDMMRAIALKIDLAALYGAGSANEPRGVINITGIGAPGTGAATHAMVVALETAVAADNADMGRLAYITDATVRGALKAADLGTGTGNFVWPIGAQELNGYPVYVTNQVTDGDMFFGNWGDLLIGLWSGLDVLVDTSTLSSSGGVRVVMFQDVDIAVRHAESFAKDATS